jgi:hypothetical protein
MTGPVLLPAFASPMQPPALRGMTARGALAAVIREPDAEACLDAGVITEQRMQSVDGDPLFRLTMTVMK